MVRPRTSTLTLAFLAIALVGASFGPLAIGFATGSSPSQVDVPFPRLGDRVTYVWGEETVVLAVENVTKVLGHDGRPVKVISVVRHFNLDDGRPVRSVSFVRLDSGWLEAYAPVGDHPVVDLWSFSFAWRETPWLWGASPLLGRTLSAGSSFTYEAGRATQSIPLEARVASVEAGVAVVDYGPTAGSPSGFESNERAVFLNNGTATFEHGVAWPLSMTLTDPRRGLSTMTFVRTAYEAGSIPLTWDLEPAVGQSRADGVRFAPSDLSGPPDSCDRRYHGITVCDLRGAFDAYRIRQRVLGNDDGFQVHHLGQGWWAKLTLDAPGDYPMRVETTERGPVAWTARPGAGVRTEFVIAHRSVDVASKHEGMTAVRGERAGTAPPRVHDGILAAQADVGDTFGQIPPSVQGFDALSWNVFRTHLTGAAVGAPGWEYTWYYLRTEAACDPALGCDAFNVQWIALDGNTGFISRLVGHWGFMEAVVAMQETPDGSAPVPPQL